MSLSRSAAMIGHAEHRQRGAGRRGRRVIDHDPGDRLAGQLVDQHRQRYTRIDHDPVRHEHQLSSAQRRQHRRARARSDNPFHIAIERILVGHGPAGGEYP